MKLSAPILLLLLLAAGSPAQADLLLTLSNGGVILGGPGDVIGWSFTLDYTNDPNGDFAVITGSDFCVGAQTSPCSNSAGSYSDFMATDNFIIVGPDPESSLVSQRFDPVSDLGTGIFTVGDADFAQPLIGAIVVSYDLYSSDPIAGDGGEFLGSGTTQAFAEIAAVPEPCSASSLCLGMSCLLGFMTLKSRRGLSFPSR